MLLNVAEPIGQRRHELMLTREMPDIIREIGSRTIDIDARAVPLAEVETVWNDTSTDQRVVLTP